MKVNTPIQRVWIDLRAHEKLWAWTRMAKGEVSMLGLVEEAPDGPIITDVFLLKQTCTAGSTDLDQADVGSLMFDLAAAGQESRLRAWIHSHAAMDVFWSSTDDKCIEGLGGDPYLVSLVVNHKGATRARVDLFHPVRVTLDEVPVQVRLPDLGLQEECRTEFEAKVNEVPATPFPLFGHDRPALFDGGSQVELFPRRPPRRLTLEDMQDLEAAVWRGELTIEEYMAAMDEGDFFEPFGQEEVAHGRGA